MRRTLLDISTERRVKRKYAWGRHHCASYISLKVYSLRRQKQLTQHNLGGENFTRRLPRESLGRFMSPMMRGVDWENNFPTIFCHFERWSDITTTKFNFQAIRFVQGWNEVAVVNQMEVQSLKCKIEIFEAYLATFFISRNKSQNLTISKLVSIFNTLHFIAYLNNFPPPFSNDLKFNLESFVRKFASWFNCSDNTIP